MVDWNLHIESDPNKLFGKPTIINTRISVDLILEKLAAGDTFEDLLAAYPKLTNNDIIACFFICCRFN
jgi:uncharacterized protein (DUF433 family)